MFNLHNEEFKLRDSRGYLDESFDILTKKKRVGKNPPYNFEPIGPNYVGPKGPPPKKYPKHNIDHYKVDPRNIRMCLYRNTYIWPKFGRGYWFYPTIIGRSSVSGYRWTGNRWIYYGTGLNNIHSFSCF